MNIGFIVVLSLAFPLLWVAVCTDRRSYDQAIKLREVITEILQSIAEWENGKLGVTKILAFKAYRASLESKLPLIRGYLLIRFLSGIPRKKSIYICSLRDFAGVLRMRLDLSTRLSSASRSPCP